ncbi:MAG: hypothetical protein KF778_05370 [Rhodocyclaceae bacterium]|nr:hypothetical protein [Rhodocyclaceae bacterium]MBX3667812.1 hypothetical protein [Rhodocyclaceae bacterium]
MDEAAKLIALLLAQRALPRTHPLVQRALIDFDFRAEIDARLAPTGLRLLDNPFAAHVALAFRTEAENAVFGGGGTWVNNNFGLARDGVALLVLIWALIVLPKRERQWLREAEQNQADLFGAAKPLPAAADASRPIAEAVLMDDYAATLGGRTRVNMNLGVLSRLGFIDRRNKLVYEGPLLDLAFDYEQIAPRIIDGALGDLLARRAPHAADLADAARAADDTPAAASGDDAIDNGAA